MDAAFSIPVLGASGTVLPGTLVTGGTGSASNVTGYSAFFTLSGTALNGVGAAGSGVYLPALTLDGLITDAKPVMPVLELSGEIAPGEVLATNPVDGLVFVPLGLTGEFDGGMAATVAFSLPMLTLEASNGMTVGNMLLFDSMGMSGEVVPGTVGSLSAQLPILSLTGAMVDLVAARFRSADMTLPMPGLLAEGMVGGGASAAFTLNALSLAGTVHAGNAASAAFTLPIFDLSVAAHTEATIASATIALPMLDLSGQVGAADLARIADGEALVVNIKTAGVTRYESFGFNSFAIFDGRQIAATSAALYALGGNDDDGTPIQMVLTTPVSDLGQQRIKRVRQAFIGYRSGGAAELHVRADEGDWHIYRLDETRVSGIYRNRVKVGRGTKGAYWQFSVRNVDGADLTLDAIEPIVEVVTTRAS